MFSSQDKVTVSVAYPDRFVRVFVRNSLMQKSNTRRVAFKGISSMAVCIGLEKVTTQINMNDYTSVYLF